MMKKLLYLVAGLVVVIVAVAAAALLFIDRIIEKAVNEAGGSVLKVETSLEKCDLSIMDGTLSLRGLELKNPAGFKSPKMIRLESIFVSLDTGSLMDDVVRIKEVNVTGADVTYEVASIGKTNISTFLNGLRKPGAAKETPKSAEGGKKVVIDKLILDKGVVNLAATFTGGKGITTPLPRIEIKDLGKDKNMSLGESMEAVFREIGGIATASAGKATDLLKGVGSSVTEAAKGVTDKTKGVAKDVTGKAAETGKDVSDKVKGLFK